MARAFHLGRLLPVYTKLIGAVGTLEDLIASLDESLDVVSVHRYVDRQYVKRYELQAFLQEVTEKKNIRLCRRGMRVVSASGAITHAPCHNAWTCPVCVDRRLIDFKQCASEVLQLADSAVTFTLTQDRDPGESLGEALSRLYSSMRSMSSGKGWEKIKRAHGIVGHGYVVELKRTPTGWHPHIHGFLVFRHVLTEEQASHLSLDVRRRWVRNSEGASIWAQHLGLLEADNLRSAVEYVTKDTPRYTTSSAVSRTVGDLLHDARAGDMEALDLLLEVESATAGRHRFSWTPNLLDHLQESTHAVLSA